MTAYTFYVTAWCSMPHYCSFEVEAANPEEALAIAKQRVHDEPAEHCGGPDEWDEFSIQDEEFEELLYREEPGLRVRSAAPKLLEALEAILPYAEEEETSLHECWKGHGEEDIKTELDSCSEAIELARQAIALAKLR